MEPRIGWGATAEFAVLIMPARMVVRMLCVCVRIALCTVYVQRRVGSY